MRTNIDHFWTLGNKFVKKKNKKKFGDTRKKRLCLQRLNHGCFLIIGFKG